MDIVRNANITNFFEILLSDLECQQDTKAYIVSIFGKYKTSEADLSKDSITILFSTAQQKHDFATYQKLGDWIIYCNGIAPQHLRNASQDYYDTIGRASYHSCYNLINRQWGLFNELSERFLVLRTGIKQRLSKIDQITNF